MKSSRTVNIAKTAAFAAAVLAASATMTACAEEPGQFETRQAASGEVCMKYNRATGDYDVRAHDSECERDTSRSHFMWVYVNHAGGYSAPPVGGKLTPGSYSTVRPAGVTVARPPATGGFGTYTASAGG